MKGIKELENVLLDQIEKLNDDSIAEDPEMAKQMIERSKAISALATSFVEINNMKLMVVKELNRNGYDSEIKSYLGIENKRGDK